MPPWELIQSTLLDRMLLPFAAALFAGLVLDPTRRIGAVLAVIVGVLAANEWKMIVEFQVVSDTPLTATDLKTAALKSLANEKTEGTPPSRYWLTWAPLLASLVGLIATLPKVPKLLSLLLAALASTLAARLLVDHEMREAHPWWLLAIAIFANWQVLSRLSSRRLTASCVVMFLAAAVVLMHAHSARHTEYCLVLAASFAAVFVSRLQAGALAPLAAVLLPGIMLVANGETYSDVPVASFMLPALAPLALAPLAFTMKHRRWLAILCAITLAGVLVTAIGLAAQAESLAVD